MSCFPGLNDDVAANILSFCDVGSVSELVSLNTAFYNALQPHWVPCLATIRTFRADPELAIVRLQSCKRLGSDDASVAAFLFDNHGRLPAKAIGQYITAPPPLRMDASPQPDLAREGVLEAYLNRLDFSADSPPQALRRLLARTRMPGRTKGAGELFHAAARRYAECWRAAAAARQAPRRLIHGYDVSLLGHDGMFILVYTMYILNADLRSPAIKTKMTRRAFATINADVNALRGAPASFFDGLYDEISAEGLPVSDTVPLAAVQPTAMARLASSLSVALAPAVGAVAEGVRERAGGAITWLRRSVGGVAAAVLHSASAVVAV